MTAALRGAGVLVTRPAHQAAALAARIRELGGDPVLSPALLIEPLSDRLARDLTPAKLSTFDLAIFVSPNAARIALAHLGKSGGLPQTLRVAAVGPGTAAELADADAGAGIGGPDGVITPSQGFDSEALLAALAPDQIAGRRIVIIRGEGGREFLGQALEARGARVEYIECYRRIRPSGTLDALLPRWRSGGIGASIVTSAEIVENLYAMAGEAGSPWVRRTPMFVPHPRVAAAAYRLGTRLVMVGGAGDAALASALETWFGRLRPRPAVTTHP